jgi:hypothetical protein
MGEVDHVAAGRPREDGRVGVEVGHANTTTVASHPPTIIAVPNARTKRSDRKSVV